MPVSNTTPEITYIANGVTTEFAFPFRLLVNTDLSVYVNSALISSNYTVTITGNTGGSVNFVSAPIDGAIVVLKRSIDLNRIVDYVEGGELGAETLDYDFDRVVMQIQDVENATLKIEVDNTVDLTGLNLINVADPVDATDPVNKSYVDGVMANTVSSLATLITFGVQYSQIVGINGTFTILERSPLLFGFDNAYFSTLRGTLSAVLRINGTPVGGLNPMSIGEVQGNANTTTNGLVQIGDKVDLVVSNTDDVSNLSILFTCVKQQGV